MSVNNPFEQINERLDQIQKSLIAWFSKQESNKNQQERTYSADFLTLPEVAIILKKPIGTVRGYIHSRGLPARRLGKPYLVRKDDFTEWLSEWQAAETQTALPTDGYSRMLEHRKKYSKS